MLQQRVLSIVTLARIIERVRLGEEVRWCIGECERGKGKVEIGLETGAKTVAMLRSLPRIKGKSLQEFWTTPPPTP